MPQADKIVQGSNSIKHQSPTTDAMFAIIKAIASSLQWTFISWMGFLNSECYHPGSGAFCQSPDNELSFTLKITKQLASIKPLDEADLMFNI
ncbi:uncharacterized protein PHALS_02213 [Plasmopara halstedii]|uniref:Uncharacterized protein n=1 Tax=Plasmopara halstedii TaxID=4781 RepID=A0A0P1A6R1_PLAHL|nr:uncharacterized protein PHALS_02213 [Plasmopara halstedii]CEG36306.1 hypothetical protein PHALS_02213 [Plasmopara halstedii]|eukprot:XP_024572675.1 hypothetical protein PHALS_02213 [Plasmopara halstedii]